MNAGKHKILLMILTVLFGLQTAFAGSARLSTLQGNKLYEQGKFDEAIKQYDQAVIDNPLVLEPKFNKANSYYRLDDLEQAMNLYKAVATESKDMKLVAKAKYNLGNCSFQQGTKQRDSNLEKAIQDMENAIGYWRGVLDTEPENEKAAKNIEVARLTIKDILDQLKNQKKQDPNQHGQQNQNQSKDPNQTQQQSQRQQDPNRPGQQQNQNQSKDPNQAQQQNQQQQSSQQDANQPKTQQQQQSSKQEPNQPQKTNQQQTEQQQQQEQKQQVSADDTAAQEILDKEQRDKNQRQTLQKARYKEVEKDW